MYTTPSLPICHLWRPWSLTIQSLSSHKDWEYDRKTKTNKQEDSIPGPIFKTIHLMGTPAKTQFIHVCNPPNLSLWPKVMRCHHKCFGFALDSTMLTPYVSSETLPDPGCSPLASPRWHHVSVCPVSNSYIVSGTVWPGAGDTVHSNPRSGSVNVVWHDTECTLRAPEM